MDGLIRVSIGFFCHDGQGKYLIQKRSQHCRDERGVWDNGGGGLKFGEDIEAALYREVWEEYRTKPLKVEPMGYRDVHRVQEGVKTHWVCLDFKVLVNPEEVSIGEPHKCDELRWVTLEELEHYPEPLHSQLPKLIQKHLSLQA